MNAAVAPTALTQPDHFKALAERVCTPGRTGDGSELRISLYLAAESSQFMRFNHAAVRQATQVIQGDLTLAVTAPADGGGGGRRIESTRSLTGNLAVDVDNLLQDRAALVADLASIPNDPHLLLPDTVACSHRHDTGVLPAPDHLVRCVATAAAGLDLVGHCASGAVVRAYADSRGQRHWHHVETFHFEWCLVAHGDKSVKSVYAGTHWDDDVYAQRVADGAAQLPLLARPPRRLAPGAYRAYFTPTAMSGLLGVTAWGGFSTKARRTGTSSLTRLERGERLHPGVSISEDAGHGAAPAFTEDGSMRPPSISLIDQGHATGTLTSTRSAREYGIEANGADEQEYPVTLSLAPGTLPAADALAALDTGLYVSDLWYLNYSDRASCRLTGMTRFACFWVDGGRLAEPLDVMRFDDSFLRMFGDGLIGLTDAAELILAGRVMRERPLGSLRTPGALVDGWQLTL